MSSNGGSKWEALLFISSVLNKSAQGDSMSGLAVKYDITGDSVLVSRWKGARFRIEYDLSPVDLCLCLPFLLTVLLP